MRIRVETQTRARPRAGDEGANEGTNEALGEERNGGDPEAQSGKDIAV